MKIKGVHRSPYNLPLHAPLPGSPTRHCQRCGVLVGLESDAGTIGWGDIAPLEGFSDETLDEADAALSAFTPVLQKLEIAADKSPLKDGVLRVLEHADLCSSLRFGLETALLNLAALQRGASWHGALTGTCCDSIAVNALASSDHMEDDVRDSVRRGYGNIKIKVGGYSPEHAAERVRDAAHAGGEGVVLRVDANRTWALDAAIRFAGLVQDFPIEYIEEPVEALSDIAPFVNQSAVPVALDESLDTLDRVIEGIHALVLKPTLRGGISGALRWAQDARAMGATPVISSAFESGVGMRALVQLAAAIGDRDVPVGLDTYRRLSDDVLEPRLDIDHPVLDVDEVLCHRVRIQVEGKRHGI